MGELRIMKKKIAIAAYIVACVNVYSAKDPGTFDVLRKDADSMIRESSQNTPSVTGGDTTQMATDEVEIDLANESLKSSEGINVKYGNLKMKTYEFQKDDENNMIKTKGDVFIEIEDGPNKAKIDTRDAEISQSGNYARFYDSKSYFQVGHITEAEAPNDKILFGGELTEYVGGRLKLKNAWFTTDPKVLESERPEEAGYHIKSRELEIIPDKQVNFRSSDLYLGEKDVLPFTVPWYAVNIRPGSKVPVFPMWGSDDDYGWYTSWGVLYGDRNSKYKGGFAPKFADQMGLLVGRWENEYKTDNYGTAKLDVTDALVYKKDSDEEDRWDADYTHTYSNSDGYLNFNLRSASQNMVSELQDIRDDNEDDGKYNPDNAGREDYLGDRPDGGSSINFLTMDTKFENAGARNDIDFYGRVKLVDDKEAYQEVVDDRLDDIDYDTQGDHDLFADVGFTKDNEDYKVAAYYEYLYDMDPGSSEKDLKTRAENFGFEMVDKRRKLSLKYDEKNEDEYRKLRSWERTPNLDDIINLQGKFDRDVEYVPWTVAKYDQNDSQNLHLGLGEYSFYNSDFDFKMDYTFKTTEKELSTGEDPFREAALDAIPPSAGNQVNKRDQQYNRYENVVYEDTREDRLAMELFTEDTRFMFAAGRTEEEFWDREGIYSYNEFEEGDAYNKYVNESDFYEVEAEQKDIDLGIFGDFGAKLNLRHDKYDKGYDQANNRYTSGGDETLRKQLTLTHEKTLFDNTKYYWRKTDTKLSNEFTYFYQDYHYKDGDDDLGTTKDDARSVRLKNKDKVFRYTDKLTLDYGNTQTIYTFDYKNVYDAADEERKKNQMIGNNVEFKIDDKKSLVLHYATDEHYTDENTTGSNNKDLDNKTYGVDYYVGNHKFYYSAEDINYDGKDLEDVDDVREKINENVYGYEYTRGLDKWQLEYIRGKDDRYNEEQDAQEIDTDNRIYSVSYLNGGDVEHYYKATYEEYEQGEEVNKRYSTDVVSLRYGYKDKRFTEEDLEKYGKLEFDKPTDELSAADLERVREILKDREKKSLDFNLRSINDEQMSNPESKRSFSLYLMFQRNKERYNDTGNYFDSLEEIQGRIYYSYNRWGVGYRFDQEAGYRDINDGSSWRETERDHEISLHAKFGKPSEGWRIKTFIGINESLDGQTNENRETLDRIGFEVGKEKGYYMWSTAFTRKYVSNNDDYEWEVAFQFTLLTFPNMPIFGIGASDDGGESSSTSVETYLFDGINVDDLDD